MLYYLSVITLSKDNRCYQQTITSAAYWTAVELFTAALLLEAVRGVACASAATESRPMTTIRKLPYRIVPNRKKWL